MSTNWGKKMTTTTRELLDFGVVTMSEEQHKKHNFFVERTWVDFTEKEFILHPYLVGLLIGDGSLSGSGSIEISLGPDQGYLISSIPLPNGIEIDSKYDQNKHYYRIRLHGITEDGRSIKELVKNIGLLGTKSGNKFIPKEYLYSSFESRQELLRGLSDTDGHINSRGRLEYSTISQELAYDVVSLLRGLGKSVSCRVHLRDNDVDSYSDTPIYRINELKGDKYGTSIDEIIPTDEYVEMCCIKVSNPDSLYITEDYIITHNTTTATVLAQAIVSTGLKYVAAGGNPLSLKRGIDKGLTTALKLIEKSAKPIVDRQQIEFVAAISGNEQEVGQVVADAIEAVGEDGIITLEESRERETYFQLVDGFSYNQGFIDPLLITDYAKNLVDYRDVNILMFNGVIKQFEHLLPVLQKLVHAKKPVLIIAENYDDIAKRTLSINKARGGNPWVATKTPGFGDQKKEMIKDICVMVGGKVFDEDLGHKYEEIDESFYGHCERVVISKDSTTIIEGAINSEAVADRITMLKSMLEREESEYNREKINERLGRLNGGVGLIKIGASTETELKEKKYRYEDALNATRAAIAEGIVIGGGSCLLKISAILESLTEVDVRDEDEVKGLRILIEAIQAPFRQICINGGFSPDVLSEKVLSSEDTIGFDAKYGEMCDLFENGVIDPAKVTKSALSNAVSIASLVLTTEALIAPVVEKSERVLVQEGMY